MSSTPVILALEFMNGGCLTGYLQESETQSVLDQSDLVQIALFVASACSYLEENEYIHRDIAARNVLINLGHNGKVKTAKLADFGLAKDLKSLGVYVSQVADLLLPQAHCAPECFLGQFTIKSDVWAFGVLLWEVFTWAAQPFGQWRHQLSRVESWVREHKKTLLDIEDESNCLVPDCVKELQKACWMYDQEDRPTFGHKVDRSSVIRCLQKIQKESSQFASVHPAATPEGHVDNAEPETEASSGNVISLTDPYCESGMHVMDVPTDDYASTFQMESIYQRKSNGDD